MTQDPPRQERIITDQMAENITRGEELAYELKIAEVMTRNMKTVVPEMRMGDVLELFRLARISGAPVVKNNELLGVISIEDLIRCLIKSDLDSNVSKYMTTRLITAKSTDPVVEALKVFVNTNVGRLPVVDENQNLIGIITKGDVTRGILKALQKDYQDEEVRRYRASHLFEDIESDRTSLILRYIIKKGDFTNGGAASSHIKRALIRMGANPLIARRCGIAIYEAEMNLIIHTTHGGALRVEIEPHQISIEANDEGPGIANIEQALKPGYTTADEEVRELGFGAGMGLVNIARCVDVMKLESTYGKGTHLKMKIFLNKEEKVGEGYPVIKENNNESK
jgi:CBS domain-containing protein/anti-sigma regulatory factor (Ser/Thr protein kinase)